VVVEAGQRRNGGVRRDRRCIVRCGRPVWPAAAADWPFRSVEKQICSFLQHNFDLHRFFCCNMVVSMIGRVGWLGARLACRGHW
jgi:hypothetical protein